MKEIIVNVNKEQKRDILLLEDGIVIEKYSESDSNDRIEGNIYLGKIKNILPGMQAAFIDIGKNKNTFIHLKDIVQKKDEKDFKVNEYLKNMNIENIAKINSNILVQVKRDETRKKGAKVSSHISIPGRFIVYMPDTNFITISQKIDDEKERKRLIKIVKETLPENCGAIIRTSCNKKKKEEIVKDLENLKEKWNEIQKKVKNSKKKAPVLIMENNNIIEKVILNNIDFNLNRIIINDNKSYYEVKNIMNKITETDKIKLILKENEDLLNMYTIKKQLERTENRKVWLKCGGFITIDNTEALTAIDVNSGKYIGKENFEETVYKVNKEASIEIAKQLRLRDIGGIIVIDYIDMQDDEDKKKIEEILVEELKKDKSKTQVAGFTRLNLFEMTRKHMFSND